MAHDEQRNKSLAARAAWPLLVFTAALQTITGLSSAASGLGGWTAATMGGLQAVAAVVVFVLAVRRDLRGATLAAAASVMLGWLSMLPSVVAQGLDFHGDEKVTPTIFVVSPLIAIAAATLAWRNVYPIAAALIVSAMTIGSILIVTVFGLLIALHGF